MVMARLPLLTLVSWLTIGLDNMKKILLIAIGLLSFAPHSLYAARFYVEAPKEISNGGEVLVNIKVDTGEDKINAFSGTIFLSNSNASVSKIYDGDSVIVLWIEHPALDAKGTSISFSGLTPGGYQGDRNLFSFAIKPSKSGAFSIIMKDMVALKNDGLGTAVKNSQISKNIFVRSDISTSTISMNDTIPPESFVSILSSSPDMYGGKAFVSFSTTDKGVGLDRYEYASTWIGRPDNRLWIIAESPFQIPGSDLYKQVFIKAIDRNGNERVSIVAPRAYYVVITTSAILILLFLCVLLFSTRRYLRSRS